MNTSNQTKLQPEDNEFIQPRNEHGEPTKPHFAYFLTLPEELLPLLTSIMTRFRELRLSPEGDSMRPGAFLVDAQLSNKLVKAPPTPTEPIQKTK